jgi:hypothetical protein
MVNNTLGRLLCILSMARPIPQQGHNKSVAQVFWQSVTYDVISAHMSANKKEKPSDR